MTLDEAIALQPAWVGMWINWLVVSVFILPLALLIWKESRIIGLVSFVAALLGGAGVFWLHSQMGFVKLLGLPHVLFWTPLAIYLFGKIKGKLTPLWPRRIMSVTFITVVVALLFDYADVIRWVFGERTPFSG